MKWSVCLFALFLLTVCPTYSHGFAQRRPSPETWYERALRHVNRNDTDFGSIWEGRKRDFMDQVGNHYFRYSLAATGAIVVLLVGSFTQYRSHRRAFRRSARSIADFKWHDEHARQAAREAIKRHNDHIEACNRVIEFESGESGASRWVSNAELETMKLEAQRSKSEAAALREENKRLREEGEKQSALIVEMSARSRGAAQTTLPFAKDSTASEYVALINQLQQELLAERKKNQRLKGTSV